MCLVARLYPTLVPVGYVDPALFDKSTHYLLQPLTLPDFLTS